MMNNDILFVCDHSMDTIGGSQESLKIIINGVKSTYDVSLLTPGVADFCDKNIKQYHFTKIQSLKDLVKKPFSFAVYLLKLSIFFRKVNFKIIHTQEQAGFFIISLLKRLHIINKNTILIHTERGLLEKYNKFIKFVFVQSIKKLDILITTTNFNKNAWENYLTVKLPQKKDIVRLIENTAGERFEIFDETLLRRNDNELSIGFAGRYCEWKGWDLVEDICNALKDYTNIKVKMVVGCLSQKDIIETKKMFKRVSDILGNRFESHLNFSLEEMDDFYYGIDLFILTSKPHTESFGRVLVEAMSRKVAILMTDCGGATEVIGKRENVMKTIDEFKDAIKCLIDNNERLKLEQDYSFNRFKTYYSLENNVNKHRQLYSDVLI